MTFKERFQKSQPSNVDLHVAAHLDWWDGWIKQNNANPENERREPLSSSEVDELYKDFAKEPLPLELKEMYMRQARGEHGYASPRLAKLLNV